MIIYKFIKQLILHRKYSRIFSKICKEENLINNLSNLFGAQFKTDWVGRVYVVLNPNLVKDRMDFQNQIFEYNDNGFDNSTYIEKWIMDKLNIASNFIKHNDLFDLLTYEIKRIDEYDNYLFVIQPITLQDYLKYSKQLLFSGIGLILIGILIYFLINLNF